MKKLITIILFTLLVGAVYSQGNNHDFVFINKAEALKITKSLLNYINSSSIQKYSGHKEINDAISVYYKGNPLCYILNLLPKGHIVISGSKELNPIRSFSLLDNYKSEFQEYERTIINEIVKEINYVAYHENDYLVKSAIDHNEACWKFWKELNLNREHSFQSYKRIDWQIIEISDQDIYLYSNAEQNQKIPQKGKSFHSHFLDNKKPYERNYRKTNHIYKYFLNLQEKCHKKKLESEIKQRKNIDSKSANIVLLSNTTYSKSDYSGDYILLGAVKNQGSSSSVFTKIRVSFYDSGNNFLGSDFTYIDGGTNVKLSLSGSYTNALFADAKGFFKLYTSIDASTVDHWTYSFDWDEYSYSLCKANIKLDGTPSFSSDYSGDVYVSGQMKNDGLNYVSFFTKVYFAFYNSSGKVIDVDFTYVDGDSYNLGWTTTDTAIYPGQSWPFESYTDAPFSNFSTYEYSFEWDEAKVDVPTYEISGRVTKNGAGLNGVEMNGLPGNPTTNASGNYMVNVDSGWSGTVTPTKEGYEFTPSSRNYSNVTSDQLNQNYSAKLIKQNLTIISGIGGTTDPSPGTYKYDYNTEISVLAIPDDHYQFENWSEDVSSSINPVTITMNSDKTIKANFRKIYPPSDFSGEKILNRTLFIAEYINVLTWNSNSLNEGINIDKYRIYNIQNSSKILLVELESSVFRFEQRDVLKDTEYIYAIAAVNSEGRESTLEYVTIR